MNEVDESLDRIAALARRIIDVPVVLVSSDTLPSPEPLVVSDARSDRRHDADLAPAEPGVVAYLGVPLVTADGENLGTLCAIDHRPHQWTDSDLATMVDLATVVQSQIQLGQMLGERRRSIQLLHATIERWARLFRYAEALAGATDIDDIVGVVLTLGAEVLGAGYVSVGSVDQRTDEILVASNRAPNRVRLLLDDGSPLCRAVRTRSPVAQTSSSDTDGFTADGWRPVPDEGFHSVLAHPLIGHRGGLCFAWHDRVEIDTDFLGVVQAMAELTGQALDRAVSYEHERRIADNLQRSLLPGRLVAVPDTEIAARYEAGADGMEVGGDWYDVAALGEGRYVLVVGDVVGRGLRAAATMGQLRHTFNALTTADDQLGPLMGHLDVAASEIDNARLSTMVAVEWQAETRQIRCISAGHLPPMVRRRDGRVEQFPDAGPPLGFSTDLVRLPVEAVLAPGDVLLMYTDGLVERRSESLDAGLARLRAVLAQVEVTSADALCDQIYERLAVEQNDDVALLVMVV